MCMFNYHSQTFCIHKNSVKTTYDRHGSSVDVESIYSNSFSFLNCILYGKIIKKKNIRMNGHWCFQGFHKDGSCKFMTSCIMELSIFLQYGKHLLPKEDLSHKSHYSLSSRWPYQKFSNYSELILLHQQHVDIFLKEIVSS